MGPGLESHQSPSQRNESNHPCIVRDEVRDSEWDTVGIVTDPRG